MAIDPNILLESIRRNVDVVGSRDVDNYKKELYDASCEIIGQEGEHQRHGINIIQKIKSIIDRTGEFLNNGG